MEISRNQVTVRDLTEGYINNQEEGVIAYDGKLDIRPPYQREFVYKDKQRNLVIDTVKKGFPLNTMYWNIKDDGTFEVLDGQQRTISICDYVDNRFSIEGVYFNNLPNDKQAQILDYELDVYKCKGTHSERLGWFETINIAGEVLTSQEIRNAIYAGPWTAVAKKWFSKTGCPAHVIGSDFVKASSIRQEYLEKALKWITNDNIDEYMGKHQHDTNADELQEYFEEVIGWIKDTFVGCDNDIRNQMKSVEWGELYNQFKGEQLDSEAIREEVSKLMKDDDVENKKGIYPYVLTRLEKYLNIRAFKDGDKQTVFEKQGGRCAKSSCKKQCKIEEMEADHIIPWSKGGKTEIENCQMLCVSCNREKSNK